MKKPLLMVKFNNAEPLGVLRFGLVWAVPPETKNPYPYLGPIFSKKKKKKKKKSTYFKSRYLFLEILSKNHKFFKMLGVCIANEP